MMQPIGYLHGKFLPTQEMTISVLDMGFMQGVTVAEQIRTFGGKLFQFEQHMRRLQRSLEIVGVTPKESLEQIGELAAEVTARNYALVDEGDDVALAIFVTPGVYPSYADFGSPDPAIGIFALPLPFGSWAAKYETGERLVSTSIRQISAQNWPAELKCRSRMHYYLADREARTVDPMARALLLNLEGNVCEASTANVLIYTQSEGLISPRQETILPGISLATVADLAQRINVPMCDRTLNLEEFYAADEVLLCSTSPCILPVVNIDGRSIADGKPGPFVGQLLSAWSEMVGIDVVAQAQQFALRSAS